MNNYVSWCGAFIQKALESNKLNMLKGDPTSDLQIIALKNNASGAGKESLPHLCHQDGWYQEKLQKWWKRLWSFFCPKDESCSICGDNGPKSCCTDFLQQHWYGDICCAKYCCSKTVTHVEFNIKVFLNLTETITKISLLQRQMAWNQPSYKSGSEIYPKLGWIVTYANFFLKTWE